MAQKKPIYSIGLFISSTKSKDTTVNIHISNKRFKIDLFSSNFENSLTLLAEYLRQVRRQEPDWVPDESELENMEFEDPLDEMHEWILQPFMPIFQEIPPLDPTHKYTLEDCLFSEEFHYTVKVMEDKMIPIYIDSTQNQEHCRIGAKLPLSINTIVPVYHPREIQVEIDEESTALPGIPRKVFINGEPQPSFYKKAYSGDVTCTTREITTYSKIHTANFDSTVLTSKLNGIVQDDEGNKLGLLLSYIDCDRATLNCIDGQDPEYSQLRHKWFDQVSRTLEQFHAHGIVWGDAKAANVLLDVNDDAYLVDYGGGYTKGWVEKEKSDSIEGDLQGLGNIRQWLFESESINE